MRLACEATWTYYRAVFAKFERRNDEEQVSQMVESGYAKCICAGDALVLFGPSAALPHRQQATALPKGGASFDVMAALVEGYCSDVNARRLRQAQRKKSSGI